MEGDTLTISKLIGMTKLVPQMQPNAGCIIENIHMVAGPFEDWSRVRSPSRAKRRRAKHRQNIRLYYTPRKDFLKLPDGTMVGHPATVRHLMRTIGESVRNKMDEMTRSALFGKTPYL